MRICDGAIVNTEFCNAFNCFKLIAGEVILLRLINIWKTQALPGLALRPLHSYTAENREASIIATHKLKIYLPSVATLECHNFATCMPVFLWQSFLTRMQ